MSGKRQNGSGSIRKRQARKDVAELGRRSVNFSARFLLPVLLGISVKLGLPLALPVLLGIEGLLGLPLALPVLLGISVKLGPPLALKSSLEVVRGASPRCGTEPARNGSLLETGMRENTSNV